MNEPKFKVKQWIRFYSNNHLVIGQIEYIIQDRGYGEFRYQTDMGEILEHSILEGR